MSSENTVRKIIEELNGKIVKTLSEPSPITASDQGLSQVEKTKAQTQENPFVPDLVTYTAADLSGMNVQPPPYVIDDLLPVGLTTIAAHPKTGKSYMALGMAYAVATGGEFFGRQADQGDVLYLDIEGAEWSVEDNLNKTNRERPRTLHFSHEAQGVDDGLTVQLERWCCRDGINPKMIVIDTIASVPGRHRRGEDAYQFSTRIAQVLQRFALDRKIAVVAITHKNKANGFKVAEALEQVTGGMGTAAKSNSIWLISRKLDEETGTVIIISKGREYQELAVRFKNCIWSLIADNRQEYESDLEYERSVTVMTARNIVRELADGASWDGTATNLRDEALLLLGDLPEQYNARAVGVDVRRFKNRLRAESIDVRITNKRVPGIVGSRPIITIKRTRN